MVSEGGIPRGSHGEWTEPHTHHVSETLSDVGAPRTPVPGMTTMSAPTPVTSNPWLEPVGDSLEVHPDEELPTSPQDSQSNPRPAWSPITPEAAHENAAKAQPDVINPVDPVKGLAESKYLGGLYDDYDGYSPTTILDYGPTPKPNERLNDAPIRPAVPAQPGPPVHQEAGIRPSSWFHKDWIILPDGQLGAGQYGTVSKVVRNITSKKYNPSEKGKVYALKRIIPAMADEDDLHSLRHEEAMHSIAKLDPSWRNLRYFAFMIDYEKNVEIPRWAVYQHCHGRTLTSIKEAFVKFIPDGLVLDVMEDISTALAWLHSEIGYKPRMAHRDLHSNNVMLDLSRPLPYGRHAYACIIDFGGADYAARDASWEQNYELERDQHTDINSFGHIVHGLIHQDFRLCGLGGHTLRDQQDHCYTQKWYKSYSRQYAPCPNRLDPNSSLFLNGDTWFWNLIIQGCFREYAADKCNIDMNMASINVHVQQYVGAARRYLQGLPYFDAMWKHYVNFIRSLDLGTTWLPPEHCPSPPPPPPPTPELPARPPPPPPPYPPVNPRSTISSSPRSFPASSPDAPGLDHDGHVHPTLRIYFNKRKRGDEDVSDNAEGKSIYGKRSRTCQTL